MHAGACQLLKPSQPCMLHPLQTCHVIVSHDLVPGIVARDEEGRAAVTLQESTQQVGGRKQTSARHKRCVQAAASQVCAVTKCGVLNASDHVKQQAVRSVCNAKGRGEF